MPSSYPQNIPLITFLMAREKPQSMLDVGPGYGKFGFMFRERVDDFKWERVCDGVDPFPNYIKRAGTRGLYNGFWVGLFGPKEPIRFMPVDREDDLGEEDRFGRWPYDLILMVDVLEHYTEEAGHEALDFALELAPSVLVSTPLGYDQGAAYGNVYETHRSEWPMHKIAQHGTFSDFSGAMGSTDDSVIGILRRI